MPWSYTGAGSGNLFQSSPSPSYLSGGSGSSLGSGLAGGGFASGPGGPDLHALDEFVTGPGMTPPAGAALTGNSSLQRSFPERVGGNLMLSTGGQPSLFEQGVRLPGQIAETPASIVDAITNGKVTQFLTAVHDKAPIVSQALDVAGSAIQRAMSVPAALMNQQPAQVISKVYDLPDSTVITPDLLKSKGLDPMMAVQFKKNGWPILGWLGLGGDLMTVKDLKDELHKRGFNIDSATGRTMGWAEVAAKASDGPLGAFQFGDKAVNESGISDFLLQSAGQMGEFALAGGLWGAGARALGFGVKSAEAVAAAENVAKDVSGMGKIAQMVSKATGKTLTPFIEGFKNPLGRLTGGWGVNAARDLEEATAGAVKAAKVSANAGEALAAAGDVSRTTLRGAAQYWAKQLLVRDSGGNLLTRYYLRQTQIRAGIFGVEQATGFAQDHGITDPTIMQLHDFTQSILDNHPLSDNSVFQMATAFTFPFKKGVGTAARMTGLPQLAGQIAGRTDAAFMNRALNIMANDAKIGLGKDAIEKLGGLESAITHLDQMKMSIAARRLLQILPADWQMKLDSVAEAMARVPMFGNSVKTVADFMVRTGKITPHDLIREFRTAHENPIITKILEDGTRVREPMFPFANTRLSNDVIIQRAVQYAEASKGITNPFFGIQTAVLGRATRMTKEDLDHAIAAAEAASQISGGHLDAQFIRDLFYQTPGMLDDLTLSENAHNFFVDAMNPARTAGYSANEVIGLLKNLKDVVPTRDQLWHDFKAKDAAAPVDPMQNGVPAGVVQNGVIRNIHSKESLDAFAVQADARLRDLAAQRDAALAKYKDEFSKRGNAKMTAADHSWSPNGNGGTVMDRVAMDGEGVYNSRSANPQDWKGGFTITGDPYATVARGDTLGLQEAVKQMRSDHPSAQVGLRMNGDVVEVSPVYHVQRRPDAVIKAGDLNQPVIHDVAKKTDIVVDGTAAIEPTLAPPKHIDGTTLKAALDRRQALRDQINSLTGQMQTVKSDIKDIRTRANQIKVSNFDPSFFTQDGTFRVHPNDVQRLKQYVDFVRQNYPQYEIEAGPRLMNLYQPDSNYIHNLMIEHDALGQRIFDWGPVSKIANAVDALTRPIRGGVESKATIGRLYEVMMKLGAKEKEVDTMLRNINDVLMEGGSIGTRVERIPFTRGMQGMNAETLARAAQKALGGNKTFMDNFVARYGGNGLERMYVPLSEAYNPAVRAVQQAIEQGGKTNRLQRLFASGYDRYHIGKTAGLAENTRLLAKWVYPLMRFALNPIYHVYTATEADIIALTQDGLRVYSPSNPASASMFSTLEKGNPEARNATLQAQRRNASLGVDPTAQGVRTASIDQTGVTFGASTRRAKMLEKQTEIRFEGQVIDTLKSFAADSPEMQAAMKRYGGTPETWVAQLAKDIYGVDQQGAANYITNMVQSQNWAPHEIAAMQPIIDKIILNTQQTFDDMFQIHVGNVNRSRLERVVNSYWLYWPASYMLKANKWMFKVLTEGAFGVKSNVGGAWTLQQLADIYHQRYLNDPNFRQVVDNNKDIEFMASMILPIAPWSDGVSLNKMTRYTGGWLGMWPQYSNFDPTDIKGWGSKMSDIGPIYAIGLVGDVAKNLGADFGVHLAQGAPSYQVIPGIINKITGKDQPKSVSNAGAAPGL